VQLAEGIAFNCTSKFDGKFQPLPDTYPSYRITGISGKEYVGICGDIHVSQMSKVMGVRKKVMGVRKNQEKPVGFKSPP